MRLEEGTEETNLSNGEDDVEVEAEGIDVASEAGDRDIKWAGHVQMDRAVIFLKSKLFRPNWTIPNGPSAESK